ncbi:MAG: hypothetical protein ACI93R_001616 [Flavobacteriales bacterium]|jgi:hypothetical protein
MRVLGVELKANEAFVCLLSSSGGLFDLPDCRLRRLAIQDPDSSQGVKDFQFAIAKLVEDYNIDKIVIRERMKRGKFAGGAVGFKLEAAIQLIDSVEVELLSPSAIKASTKEKPVPIYFADTGLKPFQEVAFTTAYVAFL